MQEKMNELMLANQISFQELASKLNISRQTLTRKLQGKTEWTHKEILILSELFHIEEPQNFFFDSL